VRLSKPFQRLKISLQNGIFTHLICWALEEDIEGQNYIFLPILKGWSLEYVILEEQLHKPVRV